MASEFPIQSDLACATLAGETVFNARDEELGYLEHVVIDLPRGCIAYAVLVRGGVFGLGERLHVFPWTALRYEPVRARFLLDIEKARLDALPGFDDDHWPAMTDAAWASAIDCSPQTAPDVGLDRQPSAALGFNMEKTSYKAEQYTYAACPRRR